MTNKEIEKILSKNKFFYFPQIEDMKIFTETFEKVDDKIVFKIRAFVPDENTDFVCKKVIPIDKLKPITLNRSALVGSNNWKILATFFKELLEMKFPDYKNFDLNEIGDCVKVEKTHYNEDNNFKIEFRFEKDNILFNCNFWYIEDGYELECMSGSNYLRPNNKISRLFRAYLRKNNFAIK